MIADMIEFASYIGNCKTAVISTHQNPDGDAAGAAFSMALTLVELGIEPFIIFDNYPEKYDFLEGRDFIYSGDCNDLAADIFISLDSSSKERLGIVAATLLDRTKKTVNIDHHISNTYFADHNYVYPEASSTCEIVYHFINHIGIIDKAIASALYAGIVFDTGGFKHTSTTAETFEIASRLVSLGIPFNTIHRETMCLRSLNEAKIFGAALDRLRFAGNGEIAVSRVYLEDFTKFGCGHNELDGIVEYILNLRGIRVSMFLSETDNGGVKVSLRSVDIDVNKIAALFGGGGHTNAAGASVKCGIDEAEEKLLTAIIEKL